MKGINIRGAARWARQKARSVAWAAIFLASLNARSVIRGRINDVDSNFHIKASLSGGKPMSREIFAHQTSDGVSSDTTIELAVHVERETYIDKEYNGSVKFAQSQVRVAPSLRLLLLNPACAARKSHQNRSSVLGSLQAPRWFKHWVARL